MAIKISGTTVITDSRALQNVTNAVLTSGNSDLSGGYTNTVDDDGTKSSGSYEPDPTTGNFKKIVNGGTFTLAAPTTSGSYSIALLITNNSSAGTVTLSGFTKQIGTDLTTTDGDDFLLQIVKIDSFVLLAIQALQ